jgi:AraC-like DNA-binding protein
MGADGRQPVARTAFTTRDPDRAHEFLGSVYADHTMWLPDRPEGFRFHHTMAGSAGFAVARVRHTGRVRIDAGPLKDVLSITTFHRGPGEITHGRESVRAGRGASLLTPTGPMRTWWDDLDNTSVVLDVEAVRAHAAALSGIEPGRLAFDGMRPLSPGLERYWQTTVAHVRDVVLTNPSAGSVVLTDAFAQLATAVLTVFPNTARAALDDAGTVSEAALRRTLEHLDAHAGDPVGAAGLAAAAGVPLRDLHRAFRRRHGRSPARQRWRARLDGAHRDLRAADPTRGDTVAAIAARWGFADPARFAVVYRAAFGRPPERTLHA